MTDDLKDTDNKNKDNSNIDNKVDQMWMQRFKRLKKYHDVNGHCDVPVNYSLDPSLHSWIISQRHYHNKGILPKYKYDLLNSIDFIWNKIDHDWMQRFKRLKKYCDVNGHCDVPVNYSLDPSLHSWIISQRHYHNKGILPKYKYDLLNSIDFIWNKIDHDWMQRFKLLKELHHVYGECIFLKRSRLLNKSLSDFVTRQRQTYKRMGKHKNGKGIRKDRFDLLNSIGFIWNENDHIWMQKFKLVKKFYDVNGHCDVPDSLLGQWLAEQRRALRRNSMKKYRFDLLNTLYVDWIMRRKGRANSKPALTTHSEETVLHQEKLEYLNLNNGCIPPSVHFANQIGKSKIWNEQLESLDPEIESEVKSLPKNAIDVSGYISMGTCNSSGDIMYNEDSASIHVPGRNPYFLQANGRHWLRWQLEWAYKKKIFTRKVIVKVVGTSTEALKGERYIIDYMTKHHPEILLFNQGKYGSDRDPQGMKLHFFCLTLIYNLHSEIANGRAAYSATMTGKLRKKIQEYYGKYIYNDDLDVLFLPFIEPSQQIKDALERKKKRKEAKKSNNTMLQYLCR